MARRRKASATLGDLLRAERERRTLTQRQAAIELGVSQPVFSAWENDQNEPGGRYLPGITRWLKTDDSVVALALYWSKLRRAESELRDAGDWPGGS